MNHTEFFKEIKKGEFRKAYIWHGDEEYVKDIAYNTFMDTVLPEFRDLNYSRIYGGEVSLIKNALETFPFMAEHRVVMAHLLPKDKEARELIEYLPHIPDESILVYYIRYKADTRNSVFKKIKEMGGEVLFDYLGEPEIVRWLKEHSKKRGLTISDDTARYLVRFSGAGMMSVSNEFEKLAAVCKTGEITREMVEDIVSDNQEYKLYTMLQAFMDGKMDAGFKELDSILGLTKEDNSLPLAGYFTSTFKNMLAVYDLRVKGVSRGDILTRLKLKDYGLRGIEKNLGGFTRDELLKAIKLFSDVSYNKFIGRKPAHAGLLDAVCEVFAPKK